MPNEPSDPKEPDEPSDPKDDSYLDSWIDRTPEPIESVIPQLQETVVEVPDTPRPTDEDREEAPNEGDAKTHDTEPPDHDSVMRSAFEHDDVGPGSRFGAEIMPLVPGGKDDITIRQELEQEDKDAARSAEQEDARDDTPWESGRPGPKVEMPDGTLLEVPDVDFEDVGPIWKTSMGRDMIRKALVITGGLGGLVFLVVLFLSSYGGEADTQTLDTTAATTQETDATGTDSGESVEESEEPLSAVEPTETASTVSVSSPETTVTDVSVTISDGTYVITVTVAGGGQAMAKSPNTQWYNPRFEVETADGEFILAGGWSPGRDYLGGVQDSDFNAVPGAVVTAEWIGPNTFQTTVSGLGVTGAVVSGTINIDAGVTNSDGSETISEAEYTWEN